MPHTIQVLQCVVCRKVRYDLNGTVCLQCGGRMALKWIPKPAWFRDQPLSKDVNMSLDQEQIERIMKELATMRADLENLIDTRVNERVAGITITDGALYETVRRGLKGEIDAALVEAMDALDVNAMIAKFQEPLTEAMTTANVDAIDDGLRRIKRSMWRGINKALDDLRAESATPAQLATMRDSLLAANSQLVIDVNATFRGIHARLDRIEALTGDASGYDVIRNLARALNATTEVLQQNV